SVATWVSFVVNTFCVSVETESEGPPLKRRVDSRGERWVSSRTSEGRCSMVRSVSGRAAGPGPPRLPNPPLNSLFTHRDANTNRPLASANLSSVMGGSRLSEASLPRRFRNTRNTNLEDASRLRCGRETTPEIQGLLSASLALHAAAALLGMHPAASAGERSHGRYALGSHRC